MLGDNFRYKTKKFTSKIGEILSFLPISANTFSMIAVMWAWLFVVMLIYEQKILALVFFLLSILWDAIDGGFAKAKNDVTKFGYYIEGIIDKWGEIVTYFGIFLLGYEIEIFLFAVFALMLSFAKPRAAMVVYIGEFDWPAVGERFERLILLSIGVFAYAFGINKLIILGFRVDLLSIVILIGVILLTIGNYQRILFAKKIIERGGIEGMGVKVRLK